MILFILFFFRSLLSFENIVILCDIKTITATTPNCVCAGEVRQIISITHARERERAHEHTNWLIDIVLFHTIYIILVRINKLLN